MGTIKYIPPDQLTNEDDLRDESVISGEYVDTDIDEYRPPEEESNSDDPYGFNE